MTRQQTWSLKAHAEVKELKTRDDRAKQKTFGMKMPGLIRQSGLVQALVFVQTRPAGGKDFLEALAAVYGTKGAELVTRAQGAPLPAYLALTRDLIDVSTWMRRFIQIELVDVDEDHHD